MPGEDLNLTSPEKKLQDAVKAGYFDPRDAVGQQFSKEAGKGKPLYEQYKECKTWAAKAAFRKAWAEKKYQE
eukprot:8899425-Alexandrium_andersonii.AAC.1